MNENFDRIVSYGRPVVSDGTPVLLPLRLLLEDKSCLHFDVRITFQCAFDGSVVVRFSLQNSKQVRADGSVAGVITETVS